MRPLHIPLEQLDCIIGNIRGVGKVHGMDHADKFRGTYDGNALVFGGCTGWGIRVVPYVSVGRPLQVTDIRRALGAGDEADHYPPRATAPLVEQAQCEQSLLLVP